MATQRELRLPQNVPSTWQGISENFAFHASPETFVTERVLRIARQNPEKQELPPILGAKILNRNVAIVSAYREVQQILCGDGSSAAGDARDPDYVAFAPYRQLMEAFFPPPNLLLSDGCPHSDRRRQWQPIVDSVASDSSKIAKVVQDYFETRSGRGEVDLYSEMKQLAWRIIMVVFYDLQPSDPQYSEYVHLHDQLLRGQFSLLPVSISIGSFWSSPRKVGIEARAKLQEMIRERLHKHGLPWLPKDMQESSLEESINHVLMFTSSLAVKALASSLTAVLCNAFLRLQCSGVEYQRLETMDSMQVSQLVQETLRLSPPIVGVMRRSTADRVVRSSEPDAKVDTKIPAGWDAWCYFPAANRDRGAYGDDANLFRADRFSDSDLPEPFAFGAGPKKCMGAGVMHLACVTVLQVMRTRGHKVSGNVGAIGVRAWLGWEEASVEAWARDMKQLPTQRPAKPLLVSMA